MRTTLNIPDELIDEVQRFSGEKTKTKAIVTVMEEYDRGRDCFGGGNEMKKQPAISQRSELGALVTELRTIIHSARRTAATTINTLQVLTNFEIGRRIVEHEQKGENRAEYGKELLKELSARLTEEFGKGFSKANLEYMRRFYLEWRHRDPLIAQKPSGQLVTEGNYQKPPEKLADPETVQKLSGKSPFTISWSHYPRQGIFVVSPVKRVATAETD